MLSYILKAVIFIISLGLLFAWNRSTFSAEKYSSFFGMRAETTAAKSLVRGNIGGLYLSLFLMTCFFVFNSDWAYPLSVIAVAIVLGRLFSFYFDGYSKVILYAFFLEVISALILLLFSFSVVV